MWQINIPNINLASKFIFNFDISSNTQKFEFGIYNITKKKNRFLSCRMADLPFSFVGSSNKYVSGQKKKEED